MRGMNSNQRRAVFMATLCTVGFSLRAASAQTAEGVTKAAIARVKSLDSQIHAVIALDPNGMDQARTIDQRPGAHGLLYGYAILLKHNIEADGPLPPTAGSLALLENVTHRDAPLVKRLRAADAVILGDEPLRMGEYPFKCIHFRLERGRRSDS